MNPNRKKESILNFEPASGISFFQRYLTLWVLLCMAAGIAVGHFMSGLVTLLNGLTVSGISLPITVLIWIMIFPMMMKVDFESIRSVGKNPKGLFVTWIVNWLVKPFSMYLVASVFPDGPVPLLDQHGPCPSVSCRSRFVRGGALHGHGFCLEHAHKGGPRLYSGAGCYE